MLQVFNFPITTGVNVSRMRPDLTSLPVVTMHAVLRTNGRSVRSGALPAACSALRSFSSSITSGMTRMPASLSPLCTAVPPLRVAIMTSSWLFTAMSRAESTRNTPLHAARSSILPSFTSVRVMFSCPHRASSRSAASFSSSFALSPMLLRGFSFFSVQPRWVLL